mmetsp:Transcript_31098/g.69078  ORF Transcript_31098/g.69078 Transcript_31098/m.69078 type:complete len:84 (-) Transcript_31098:573-824(-)
MRYQYTWHGTRELLLPNYQLLLPGSSVASAKLPGWRGPPDTCCTFTTHSNRQQGESTHWWIPCPALSMRLAKQATGPKIKPHL